MKKTKPYASPKINLLELFGAGDEVLMTSGVGDGNRLNITGYDDSPWDLS